MLAGGIYLWYTDPGEGKCEYAPAPRRERQCTPRAAAAARLCLRVGDMQMHNCLKAGPRCSLPPYTGCCAPARVISARAAAVVSLCPAPEATPPALTVGRPTARGTASPAARAATALLVLGSICFLPGAYHTRVAYLAWRGVEGYSLNSIPDF